MGFVMKEFDESEKERDFAKIKMIFERVFCGKEREKEKGKGLSYGKCI